MGCFLWGGNWIFIFIIWFLLCGFVWVWNFVADIAGGKEAGGVLEYGFEENIWTVKGRGNGGMEEIA